MAKKFYGIDAYGKFLVERVTFLPSHSSDDEGRLIYDSINNNFYIGGGSGWIRIVLNDGKTYNNLFAAAESTKYASAVPPVADFSAPSPLQGVTPVTKTFTNLTNGYYTGLEWDFNNDGVIESTDENPTYTFITPGVYDVKLTALAPVGNSTEIKIPYITVYHPPPVPDFSASPTTGDAPLFVTFTDLSTGVINAYYWDFDNNGSIDSVLSDPTYTYNTPGIYSVKLTLVADSGSLVDELKTNYITVYYPPPDADFTASPTSGIVPLSVSFTNTTDDKGFPGISYEWDFDNNGTVDSTLVNPTHIYTSPGTYSVKLRAIGDGPNEDIRLRSNYITALPSCFELNASATAGFLAFGSDSGGVRYNLNNRYTVSTGVWALRASVPGGWRIAKAVRIVNGTYTALCGSDTNKNEIYSDSLNSWSVGALATRSRSNHSACEGRIGTPGYGWAQYVCFGNVGFTFFNQTDRYRSDLNSWAVRASTPFTSFGAAGTSINGDPHMTGGYPGNSNIRYNHTGNNWSYRAAMPINLYRHVSTNSDCYGFVMNGTTVAGVIAQNVNYRFDPVANSWVTRAVTVQTVYNNQATRIGPYLIFNHTGGRDSSGTYPASHARYWPNLNTWLLVTFFPGRTQATYRG